MDCLELQIPPLPQFITIGHSTWTPGMVHFKRSFSVYDLLFVVKGALFMREQQQHYQIGPGMLLVLEPGREHEGYAPCEADTEVYWIHFNHPAALRVLDHDTIPWSHVLPQGTDRDSQSQPQSMYIPKFANFDTIALTPILQEMAEAHRNFSVSQALTIHTLLARLLLQMQLGLRARAQSRSLHVCEQIMACLHAQIDQPFHSSQLEAELHFHFDYLSRCLRRHTGMTPVQYLHHIRIEQAKSLLLSTQLPIQEIARQCGMPDANYFSRIFRQKSGHTPSDFRRLREIPAALL